MAITCLTDFIGLNGACEDASPASGIFINDLPGISLRMISSLSNDEQESYKGVWEEVQRRSLVQLEGDLTVRLQKYFKRKLLLENVSVGDVINPLETESPSAKYKGVALDVFGSRNMQVFVSHVILYSASAVTTSIKIFDYASGVLLDTISATLGIGYNTIQINKSYDLNSQRRKFFIAYDGTSVTSYKSTLLAYNESQPSYSNLRSGSVSTASQVNESNITFDGNSGGLQVVYSLSCSIGSLICNNKDLLKTALWYKLGEQLMWERMLSNRINEFTLLDDEQANEARALYLTKYQEQIELVASSLMPSGDDICFECERERNYIYNLP